MLAMLFPILAGVACILLGISNRMGNISTIHEYHRKRVTEQDRIPFGKQVGLGTMVVGIGIVVFGILSIIAIKTEQNLFLWTGTAVMAVGFVVGIAVSFAAMIKYNKGIF